MASEIIKESEEKTVLKLEGELTVFNSAEIKNLYSELFDNSNELVVDHSSATDFDFSYLQLITAALIKNEKEGKKLNLTENLPAGLIEIINDSGFSNTMNFFNVNNE